MSSLWFYYTLKPYLPWSVRIGLRRLAARRARQRHSSTWPIDPAAGQAPAGWKGWPEGKRFAFVISHDVEGREGLENCRKLAELEMELGFRSSFNFVPEGEYSVPASLRAWLLENGFEVGVHDLHHDGKLYSSREGFRKKSARINGYLREWGAVGFRSGFMLRNLDWMHDLDIGYDSSTFDTDPFEPQSEGEGTIFPFWVRSPHSRPPTSDLRPPTSDFRPGYVELPYTLPQDSTLFLILRERSPEVWLRKLDWISQKGGMALVNVHPDYIAFGSEGGARSYPQSFYSDLLKHVSTQHAGEYWHPLPRQVAAWAHPRREAKPEPAAEPAAQLARPEPLRRKRAAVLLFSHYPSDPRPRRAAEAMIAAGMEVDLLCLGGPNDAPNETIAGVNVFRVPLQRDRSSKVGYLLQYGRFFLSSLLFLTRRSVSRAFDIVHVHNMPDFLVFAAIVPKLQGARIALDLHDPMPELMMSIYGLKAGDWPVRLMRAVERLSIGFADLALTPNRSFKDLFDTRSSGPGKMKIVMNSPEEKIFDPSLYPAVSRTGTPAFRVMHHGSILHRHGIDILVEAVARARESIPEIELHIYGSREPFLDTVLETARRLGVAEIVHYHGSKSQSEIARAILECDVGVIPNRRAPFTEINFPTRIFEYLAMGRPVITPTTQGIRDYFSDEEIIRFEPENVEELAARLIWVRRNPGEAAKYVARGAEVYRRHAWRNERLVFTSFVSETLAPGAVS